MKELPVTWVWQLYSIYCNPAAHTAESSAVLGELDTVLHRPGRKLRAGAEVQRQVMDWVASKPDLTLVQVQAKLHSEAGISLSLGRIWHLLKKLGLRLKKSHSTRSSGIAKPTASAAKSSWRVSSRSPRSG